MRRILAALFALTILTSCSSSNEPSKFTETAETPSPTATIPTPTPPTPEPTQEPPVDTPPSVSKILFIVGENKGFNQVKSGAPWIWSVAGKYAVLMDHRACGHPSLKNYISWAAGDCYPSDDKEAKDHNFGGRNVFYEAIKAHRDARIYVQSLSTKTCPQSKFGSYGVSRHVPWSYFRKEAGSYTACKKNVVGLYNLQKDIDVGHQPNIGMVVPNNCDNAHDCSIKKFDAFAKKYVTAAMASPDYENGHLLIAVTFDEDNRQEGNKVMTVFIHESFAHKVVTSRTTHYSFSAMLSRFGNSAPLLKAKDAPSLPKALGLIVD